MKWISVLEKMPEPYIGVLCFVKSETLKDFPEDGSQFVGYFSDSGKRWSCVYGDGWIPYSKEEITHWMPLPEPPDEVD